jgi:hypothetical protein
MGGGVSTAEEKAMLDMEKRIWQWKVEPGMEDAFDDLLGWLLSSQRNTEAETAVISPSTPPLQHLHRRALWSRCCARAAYRAA